MKKIDDLFLELDETDLELFKELNDLYYEFLLDSQKELFTLYILFYKNDKLNLNRRTSYYGKKQKVITGFINELKIDELGVEVEKKVTKYLNNIYDDILKEKFDGYTLQESTEENKRNLIKNIKKTLRAGALKRTEPHKLALELRKDFNKSRTGIESTVRTFGTLALNKMYIESFKKEVNYRNKVTMDERTSLICRGIYKDNKVYSMKDYEVGVTAPPFHRRCRTRIEVL